MGCRLAVRDDHRTRVARPFSRLVVPAALRTDRAPGKAGLQRRGRYLGEDVVDNSAPFAGPLCAARPNTGIGETNRFSVRTLLEDRLSSRCREATFLLIDLVACRSWASPFDVSVKA